jgi:hypothetical protein
VTWVIIQPLVPHGHCWDQLIIYIYIYVNIWLSMYNIVCYAYHHLSRIISLLNLQLYWLVQIEKWHSHAAWVAFHPSEVFMSFPGFRQLFICEPLCQAPCSSSNVASGMGLLHPEQYCSDREWPGRLKMATSFKGPVSCLAEWLPNMSSIVYIHICIIYYIWYYVNIYIHIDDS